MIPAYSTGSVVERQLDLLVYIGNDTEVKLEIETGLYVTIPVFNDTVERLEKDIEEVRYIVDSTTAKKYEWAMESGTLSLDEVDGDTKINIADKETLDAVKEKVDLIHTNTEGLSGKIGETNDSGGSEAAGSVFAKLNKIIGDIAAHVKQWTAERAAKLDQLDTINENAKTASTKATELVEDVAELKAAVAQETTVEGISNKIGAEGDADTQPTLFGRLAQLKNVLVEKLTEVITKITGIDSKIGTSSDTSEDETLFGKNAMLGNKIESLSEYGLDLFQKNKLDGISLTNPTLTNEQKIVLFKKVGQFVCKSRGKISMKTTLTFRTKSTASTSAQVIVNYVLNNKAYAEMDMGATSNQSSIESEGVTLVGKGISSSSGAWSQPTTVTNDSNVIEVSKGDVLTFFIGSRASEGSSYTYYWDIQNATVEGFAMK